MGTPSADTVLFGDCRWDDIPATTVVALDMGETTTTASTYQTVGPTASLAATTGQTITVYVAGIILALGPSAECDFRLINLSTNTELFVDLDTNSVQRMQSASFIDAAPSVTTDNQYAVQARSISGFCSFRVDTIGSSPPGSENNRGIIAVVT